MAVETQAPATVLPMTGEEYLESCATAARSTSTASGSRTSRRTRRSATRADGRPALRRAARSRGPRRADRPDRHRQRRLHPPLLPRAAHRPRTWSATATRSPPGRAWPTAGWAARPTTRPRSSATLGANTEFYDAVPGQRPPLVQGRAGALPVLQPRDRQPADRPRPGPTRCATCTCTSRGDRRGLIVSGAKVVATGSALTNYNFIAHYGPADQEQGVRADLRGPDGRAGREADLPAVVRDGGRGHGHPVRLPAVEPDGRERLDPRLRQGADPVGERLHLRRRRQDQRLLPGVRASSRASRSRAARASPSSSTSSPACC